MIPRIAMLPFEVSQDFALGLLVEGGYDIVFFEFIKTIDKPKEYEEYAVVRILSKERFARRVWSVFASKFSDHLFRRVKWKQEFKRPEEGFSLLMHHASEVAEIFKTEGFEADDLSGESFPKQKSE